MTSATADGLIHNQEESASGANIPLVSDGRGVDKDRTRVLETGTEGVPVIILVLENKTHWVMLNRQ